jgi:hypothetical protein
LTQPASVVRLNPLLRDPVHPQSAQRSSHVACQGRLLRSGVLRGARGRG